MTLQRAASGRGIFATSRPLLVTFFLLWVGTGLSCQKTTPYFQHVYSAACLALRPTFLQGQTSSSAVTEEAAGAGKQLREL